MEKDLFSYNTDISKNAYLNWRTDKLDISYDLYVLAECFADSAEILMKEIIKNNCDKKADSIIFPILYAIDQSIELYLKAIIRTIESINGCVHNYTTHDIQSLLNEMLSLIKKKELKTKGLNKHITPVNKYINELYAKIKVKKEGRDNLNIDFARYPIDTAGEPHFYVTEEDNVVIDVENLMLRYKNIKECLESIYYLYENEKEGLV